MQRSSRKYSCIFGIALLFFALSDGTLCLVVTVGGRRGRLAAGSSIYSSPHSNENEVSRRQFIWAATRKIFLLPTVVVAAAGGASAAVAATASATVPGHLLNSIPLPKLANPFVRFETVGMVPKAYFDENRSIYAMAERVLDGDTLRVRHVPGYSLTNQMPEPLQKRGIVDDTLVVRLYGIDCPEIAKSKNQTSQPFANEAKQFASDLVYHQMVKVTFIRKDRYGRAIAMVETLPAAGFLLSGVPGLGPKDLTIELARQGLAELYTGGGAQYYTKKLDIMDVINEARREKRGIWSLGDNYVSAAEQKRALRSEAQDPAGVLAY